MRQPWVPYSWLAEVGMKSLWDTGGYRAAVATQAVIEALLYRDARTVAAIETTRVGGWIAKIYRRCAVATVFGTFLSLAYLSFRPVTAVLVILALIAWILLRDRRMNQRSRAVWIIPPLVVLAANMIFSAVLAPLWMFALLVGDLLDNYSRRHLAYSQNKNFTPNPLPEYMERGQEGRSARRVGRDVALLRQRHSPAS